MSSTTSSVTVPINYDALLAARVDDEPLSYTTRDAILYALACGYGHDADASPELDYVYDGRGLRTVPSMAANLMGTTFLDDCGLSSPHLAHSEQSLQLYRPLPPAGDLRADRRVIAVQDHGRGAGASIMLESEVRSAKDQTVLFTLGSTLFAANDGGFGGPEGSGLRRHKLPTREADLVCDIATRREQALLFRLSGDSNPLYAEPQIARHLGFNAPPLQEQCVAGIACRALLKTICEYDFTLIAGFDFCLRGPVYPGEVLKTEMWQDRNVVSFRCSVASRGGVVIDNGKCTLAA